MSGRSVIIVAPNKFNSIILALALTGAGSNSTTNIYIKELRRNIKDRPRAYFQDQNFVQTCQLNAISQE